MPEGDSAGLTVSSAAARRLSPGARVVSDKSALLVSAGVRRESCAERCWAEADIANDRQKKVISATHRRDHRAISCLVLRCFSSGPVTFHGRVPNKNVSGREESEGINIGGIFKDFPW